MTPDDDTTDALAAIRGLGSQRAADEEAERTAVPGAPADQVALALLLVDEQRAPTDDERRVLGVPRHVDDGGRPTVGERLRESVHRKLGELPAELVVDGWFERAEQSNGIRAVQVVAGAFARLASVDRGLARLRTLLASPTPATRRLVRDMVIASGRSDPALVAVLRSILTSDDTPREVAEDAIRVAAAMAGRSEASAALIVARARRDRIQRRADALSALPLVESMAAARAVSTDVLADAAVASRSPLLIATAKLELERAASTQERERWGRALVASDPDGTAYLSRMRRRPGWGMVTGAPQNAAGTLPHSADPLDDLLSPIADVRRRALDELAATPRADRLQALLLAAELDRFVALTLERSAWQSLQARSWLPLLAPYGHREAQDLLLARASDGQLDILRADQLVEELIGAGVARRPFAVPQVLTEALRDLAARGVEAVAGELVTPPLDEHERADLDAREAEIASRA